MPVATLTAIRNKVRRLTRSISVNQLSDADLTEYINTAYAYDLPENLRLFSLRQTLTFYTQPNVDTYSTNTVTATDPLFDFRNAIITVHPPMYVAGYEVLFSESREQFFNIFPRINLVQATGQVGDGVTTAFAGTIQGITSGSAILRNNVTFNSIGANNAGLVVTDVPLNNATGNFRVPNGALIAGSSINYLTGAWNFTFPSAPALNEPINSEIVIYQPSRPQAVLFFNNEFTLRPIPDQVYPVNLEVYVRPADLDGANPGTSEPILEQWWQYLAMLASLKIFQDRMDMESYNTLYPWCKEQERLVLRRTLVLQANKRTATIFTNQLELGGARGWNYWGLY